MLKFQFCLQKYTIHVKSPTFLVENLLFGKDFLDFLVGFGQFVLAELDQFLSTFQLVGHLVDVEFIVFHLADDGLEFGKCCLVF